MKIINTKKPRAERGIWHYEDTDGKALCYKRSTGMRIAETPAAVNCPKCKKLLKEMEK